MQERFELTYEMPSFSLTRSAEQILVQIERLARRVSTVDGQPVAADREAWGDLFLQTQALLALASPILIDLGSAARESGGFTGVIRPGAFEMDTVRPFTPPLLPNGGR
jgi:methionyl-tRNA synthetase